MNNKSLIFSLIVFLSSVITEKAYCIRLVITEPMKEGQYIDRTDIEEIMIEDGRVVTEIPDYTFLGCTSLKRVILPEGLKKIGFQAFSECSALEEINFPESLQDIGSNSFT